MVISAASAMRQSAANRQTKMATGASRLAVNSGTMWASVVSIASIRSTSVLFKAPLGWSSTSPRGIRARRSVQFLRISPSTAKVALWEQAVEMAWNTTRGTHSPAQWLAYANHYKGNC